MPKVKARCQKPQVEAKASRSRAKAEVRTPQIKESSYTISARSQGISSVTAMHSKVSRKPRAMRSRLSKPMPIPAVQQIQVPKQVRQIKAIKSISIIWNFFIEEISMPILEEIDLIDFNFDRRSLYMIRSLEPEFYEIICTDEDSERENDSSPRLNLFVCSPISLAEGLNSISDPIECGDPINSEIE